MAMATGHVGNTLGEGTKAKHWYQWCLGKSLVILLLDCQRGAGALAQAGPWLPSQQDLGWEQGEVLL